MMMKGFQALLGLLVIGVIVYFLYPVVIAKPEPVSFTLENYQKNPQGSIDGYVLGRFKFSNKTDQPVYVVYNCTATDNNGKEYFTTAVTAYPLGKGSGYYEDKFLFWYYPNFPGKLPSYEAVQSITLDGFTYSVDKPFQQ